jgi:CubicO group peptidase (beta-lactamase class C family)
MMLVERGLIHLGAPLSAYLPEFSSPQALVTNAERLDQTEARRCRLFISF